ncbi:MAG: hypothetical protein WCJ18_01495 [Planctomycetota bacterium]
MISGLDELNQANALVEEYKAELRQEGIPFDERLEIGLAAADGGRAEGDRGIRAGGGRAVVHAALKLGQRGRVDGGVRRRAARAVDAGGSRTGFHGERVARGDAGIAVAEGAGDAKAFRREVRDRHHEVGNLIRDAVDLTPRELRARDLQHLILDRVVEVQRLEEQLEGALQ